MELLYEPMAVLAVTSYLFALHFLARATCRCCTHLLVNIHFLLMSLQMLLYDYTPQSAAMALVYVVSDIEGLSRLINASMCTGLASADIDSMRIIAATERACTADL